jgi:YidC/Oxa1 family membrane protein insertase
VLGVAVGDTSGVTNTRLFAGPLQFDVLGSIHTTGPGRQTNGEDLKPLIQFGFLKVIAEPLFLLLRWSTALSATGAGRSCWSPSSSTC